MEISVLIFYCLSFVFFSLIYHFGQLQKVFISLSFFNANPFWGTNFLHVKRISLHANNRLLDVSKS